MITYEQFLFRHHFWELIKHYDNEEIATLTGWTTKYVYYKKYNHGKNLQWHWSGSALLKAYQRKNRREWLSTL